MLDKNNLTRNEYSIGLWIKTPIGIMLCRVANKNTKTELSLQFICVV